MAEAYVSEAPPEPTAGPVAPSSVMVVLVAIPRRSGCRPRWMGKDRSVRDRIVILVADAVSLGVALIGRSSHTWWRVGDGSHPPEKGVARLSHASRCLTPPAPTLRWRFLSLCLGWTAVGWSPWSNHTHLTFSFFFIPFLGCL